MQQCKIVKNTIEINLNGLYFTQNIYGFNGQSYAVMCQTHVCAPDHSRRVQPSAHEHQTPQAFSLHVTAHGRH